MIEFNGKITEKDYTEYLKTYLLHSTSISKLIVIMILIAPVMVIVFCI